MKKGTIFLAITMLLSIETSAQVEGRKVGLPDSISWNLNRYEQEHLLPRGYIVPEKWNIWSRPDTISVKLVYLKVSDIKSRNDSRIGTLIANARRIGLSPCPSWVPIQLYMDRDYKKRSVWVITDQSASGSVPTFGCDKSLAHTSRCERATLINKSGGKIMDQDILVFIRK